jgi:hypothetical protein
MVKGRIYFDRHFHADYQPPHEALGLFLENDVQGSTTTCDLLLGVCKEIADGSRHDFAGTGNAHTVLISGNRVSIENVWTDEVPRCEMSIDDFTAALVGWRELIQHYKNKSGSP